MRSDNKADLEKLADRIRDSKDKALVRELLVRVQKLHRLTLAYYMFSVCSCNSRRSRRRSTTPLWMTPHADTSAGSATTDAATGAR